MLVKLTEKVDAQKTEIDTLREDHTAKIVTLEKDYSTLQEDHATLQKDHDALQKDHDVLQKAVNEQGQMLDVTLGALMTFENAITHGKFAEV